MKVKVKTDFWFEEIQLYLKLEGAEKKGEF